MDRREPGQDLATPLAGVRVVDLSQQIAGPYCTKLLADAGADVVKLEPLGGDPLRRYSAGPAGPAAPPGGRGGALFQFLHTSKRSIAADLGSEAGRALLLDLAASAELVVESFEPGEIESLGLCAEALQARNPLVSVLSLSPFGRGGPWSRRPASEFTLQAACGSTGSRGDPAHPPLAAGGRLGEWAGGVFGAVAALLALRRSRRRGRGEHVDLSLFEAMSLSLVFYEPLHASLSEDPAAFAAAYTRTLEVPSIERAADGFVGFALFTPQMWRDFLALVGRSDLADDDDLSQMLSRWPRRREVEAAIRPWLRRHRVAEIVERASRLRIPVAPIGDGETLPGLEPFRSLGSFVRNPGGGFLQPRVPYRLSRAGTRPFEAAPRLDEHGAALRAELARGAPRARPAPRGDPEAPPARPLDGLRVVDLTQFLAGPLATFVLGSLGADVVKVEAVQRPDGSRLASARPRSDRRWEYGWLFHGLNAGKRSITLDLSRPAGVELAKRLIRRADFVVENFAPRVMERFGLGELEVARLNPAAILVRMPAFGLAGPWRERGGLAQTMEQLCGLAHRTGFRNGPPVIPRGPCDPIAGLHATFAALLALAHRDRSGEGQLVESIMAESALNVAAEPVVEFSASGQRIGRDGNRDPACAPQNVYACRGEERWLALSVADDAQWRALRRWLGDPAWARDPALDALAGRRAAADRLDAELAAAFAGAELGPAVEALCAAGVPAAEVIAAPDLAQNPQHRARRFFEALDHPLAGRQEYPALPLRSSAGPERFLATPPPLLGQHNDEVLGGELGLSPAQLAALRADAIVGERPAGS